MMFLIFIKYLCIDWLAAYLDYPVLFFYIAEQCLFIVIKIISLLVAIAYYTLAERKVMAAVQRRRGPNVVGLWGLLQPLADGLKLFSKEMLFPARINIYIFVLAPVLILALSLLA
jgi:NADH:ubiquinone oxidoreductase subunit H